MACRYPAPEEVGIKVPRSLMEARFRRGFRHALAGGQHCAVEHFRLSFREGFRAGKCYARELRRAHGIMDFPLRARVRLAVHHSSHEIEGSRRSALRGGRRRSSQAR